MNELLKGSAIAHLLYDCIRLELRTSDNEKQEFVVIILVESVEFLVGMNT